jgi:hypothetical protein
VQCNRSGKQEFDDLNSRNARDIADGSSKLIEPDFAAKWLRIAAWLAFAFIVFATLAPLQFRPVVSHHAQLERFAAFATVGLFFGLAYPRQWILDWSFLIAAAGLLEALQHLAGDRHGHLRDAVAKALGGTFGIGVALLILALVAGYRPLIFRAYPVDPKVRRGQPNSFRAPTVQRQDTDTRS